MARRLGAVDMPDERRVHRIPIPRLGGLAMFFGIIVPSLAFLDLSRPVRGILLGADRRDGRRRDRRLPRPALVGEARRPGRRRRRSRSIFGVWIDHFTFPFLGVYDLSDWVGGPLTVLWIVAVMNMVNFLDGLDGLAAGVCSIAGADLHA